MTSPDLKVEQIPQNVKGLNNTCFPEGRGSGPKATDKLPTVASAARAARFSIPTPLETATSIDYELKKDIERMDGESGMQIVRLGHSIPTAEEIATTVDPVVLASVGSMDWEKG